MSTTNIETYTFPLELSSSKLVKQLRAWPYKQRRSYCWDNFQPRFERFTYRYSSFNSEDNISIERAKDVLLRSSMWLSAPQDFNDPFDCHAQTINEESATKRRAKVDLLIRKFEPNLNGLKRRHRVDQLMTRPPSEWFKTISRMMREDIRSLGVVCFSDDPRSLLMWSHYARNHTGVCYQYEPINDLDIFSRALQVEYTNIYPTFNPFTYKDDESIKMLLTKYKDWKYEKERRIIAPGGAHKYLKFSPSSLSGIVIGARTSESDISVLLQVITERNAQGLPPVKVYQIRQHVGFYRLTIHKGNDGIRGSDFN